MLQDAKLRFNDSIFIKGNSLKSINSKEINHEIFIPIFCDILTYLKYEGIACFDYKVTSNGELKIFELNPRFGSSLSKFIHEMVLVYRRFSMVGKSRS